MQSCGCCASPSVRLQMAKHDCRLCTGTSATGCQHTCLGLPEKFACCMGLYMKCDMPKVCINIWSMVVAQEMRRASGQ